MFGCIFQYDKFCMMFVGNHVGNLLVLMCNGGWDGFSSNLCYIYCTVIWSSSFGVVGTAISKAYNFGLVICGCLGFGFSTFSTVASGTHSANCDYNAFPSTPPLTGVGGSHDVNLTGATGTTVQNAGSSGATSVDARLHASSLCIGAATPTDTTFLTTGNDATGLAKGSIAWDIGAWEFAAESAVAISDVWYVVYPMMHMLVR